MSDTGKGNDKSNQDSVLSPDDGLVRERKRRRGAHACDVCRSRKVRCDGNLPCSNCNASEIDCTYGAEGLAKGKTDQILEGMQRVESSINELRILMAQQSQNGIAKALSSTPALSTATTEDAVIANKDLPSGHSQDDDRWTNAVLSAQHISSTESLLRWECFDPLSNLRQNKHAVFLLEQQRTDPEPRATGLPLVSTEEIRRILSEFCKTVNFAYPILTAEEIEVVEQLLDDQELHESSVWCRALLVMGLGCASLVVDSVDPFKSHPTYDQQRYQELADTYFGLFCKQSYVIHHKTSVLDTQSSLFAALYFAYLQRPLQAWSYINLTATKCKCLLSYDTTITKLEAECLKRIFWSCFILESDYLAELAALPQSGVGEIESTIQLPADYHTSRIPSERELSSLYFLACISMRRLLNRVHDLLYAPKTGVGLDDSRFPQIVHELDHQLEQWRAYLPQAFSFTIDTESTSNEHGGFLRQRYLTCRSVIYRPFLTRALRDECEESVLQKSQVCLDACILHIRNLKPFKHTVLIDTWICSLSMASAMLVLLAAFQRPQLKFYLATKIPGLGPHLVQLIDSWSQIPGDSRSPSVIQSLDIIREVDSYISQNVNTRSVR